MATRKPDPVKYSSPDGGKTKYIENQRVADDLKKLKKPVNAVAGKASGDKSKRMAKNKEYAARKRSSTPTKRTTAGGPAQRPTRPVSRPQNVQGPLMQNGSYGNGPTPPAQTFAQNGQQRGAPPQPQYNPLPQQPMIQQRPSAFGQPNSAMTMGIQPMGNPYMNSQNPAQMMQGYQPPMGNPNPLGETMVENQMRDIFLRFEVLNAKDASARWGYIHAMAIVAVSPSFINSGSGIVLAGSGATIFVAESPKQVMKMLFEEE